MGSPRRQTLGPLAGATRRPGLLMESGVQKRLKVTRWTAGSRWGLSQLPRLHPSSRPSAAGVGWRGRWAPTGAFSGHRGTVLCSSTVPLFALCQAAASLNPADEEEPVPASTNTRGFWREAVPGSLTQWVDLKAQRAVRGQGRAQAGVPFKILRRSKHTHRNPADHHTSETPPAGFALGRGGGIVRIIYSQKAERLGHMPVFPKQTGNAEDKHK